MFSIDVKRDKVVGVIMTYVSREMHFHSRAINCHWVKWTKLNTLFNKINECELMQIEEYLIYLKHLSFDQIKVYLAHINELQQK